MRDDDGIMLLVLQSETKLLIHADSLRVLYIVETQAHAREIGMLSYSCVHKNRNQINDARRIVDMI